MLSSSVVRVRIPTLMDAATYISAGVMSLLALRRLDSLQGQLLFLGLVVVFGLLYRFVFRTGRYEKNPVLYFGSQLGVLSLMLVLGSNSLDAINFIFLIVALHAALVLTRKAAIAWGVLYYLTVTAAAFIRSGANAYYAAAFYSVAYVVIGFFGYILQQAELAREHNQQLVDELQSTQQRLQELAVVEERNRLARDLHDSVKQQVFAISMQLSAARTALSQDDKAYPSVAEAERLAQQAGAELTTLIHQLRPPSLERKSLTDAVREHVREWMRQNNIETELSIEDVSVSLNVEQALFRVLQEALANVARHSKADKVLVSLNSENDNVILVVEDNGIGYDAERITRGIGLDSMRERLEVVNGELEISSQRNTGYCKGEEVLMAESISVLLVDDHEMVRQGVKAFLTTQPDISVVGAAASGEEAIKLAAQFIPDVILMDLIMPGMDGVESTRRVKQISPRSQIVVLTSYHEDEHIFPALKAGALSYILKDVSAEELASAVRKAAAGEAVLHPRVAARVIKELQGKRGDALNPFTELSERELEVLKLIADGMSNAEMAAKLVLSEKTIKGHVSNILSKLHLADRTQAAVYAWREGIVRKESRGPQ